MVLNIRIVSKYFNYLLNAIYLKYGDSLGVHLKLAKISLACKDLKVDEVDLPRTEEQNYNASPLTTLFFAGEELRMILIKGTDASVGWVKICSTKELLRMFTHAHKWRDRVRNGPL